MRTIGGVWRAVAAGNAAGTGAYAAAPRGSRSERSKGDQRNLVVAIDALAPLVTLLRLDRQRRDRTRLEAAQRDRLAGLLAIAVGAVVDARERGLDLGDQLALAIACAQLDRAVGLRRCPVGKVGVVFVLGLEMRQRLLGLLEDVLFPGQQLLAKVFALPLVHERLFVGRTVVLLVHGRGCGHAMAVLLLHRNRPTVLLIWHRFPALTGA